MDMQIAELQAPRHLLDLLTTELQGQRRLLDTMLERLDKTDRRS